MEGDLKFDIYSVLRVKWKDDAGTQIYYHSGSTSTYDSWADGTDLDTGNNTLFNKITSEPLYKIRHHSTYAETDGTGFHTFPYDTVTLL